MKKTTCKINDLTSHMQYQLLDYGICESMQAIAQVLASDNSLQEELGTTISTLSLFQNNYPMFFNSANVYTVQKRVKGEFEKFSQDTLNPAINDLSTILKDLLSGRSQISFSKEIRRTGSYIQQEFITIEKNFRTQVGEEVLLSPLGEFAQQFNFRKDYLSSLFRINQPISVWYNMNLPKKEETKEMLARTL